jgi:hypothetical protein
MRKVGFTLSMIIAVVAAALFTWSVLEKEAGYAVASAMLTASALYSGIRGPQVCPEDVPAVRRKGRSNAAVGA